MKNKIIALLLAVITVFYACPIYSLPLTANAQEQSSATANSPLEMVAGKLYSARFDNTASLAAIFLYKDASASESTVTRVDKLLLPEVLTVKLENASDKCVRVTNKDWPEEYEAYRYLDLDDVVIVECLETENGYILGKVGISGETVVNNKVSVAHGEKITVAVELASDIGDRVSYKWQFRLADGRWANISGYIFSYAILSHALLANATIDGKVDLRCLVTADDAVYASSVLEAKLVDKSEPIISESTQTSMVSSTSAVTRSVVRATSDEGGTSTGSSDAFHVAISYTYRHATPSSALKEQNGIKFDGSTAANTFTVSLPAGGYYSSTIATPPEVGYLPYVKVEDKQYVTPGTSSDEIITYDGVDYVAANSIEFNFVTSETNVHVYYIPQEVEYVIKIYEQDIYDDDYTLAATFTEKGLANADVAAGLDTKYKRAGFYALPYELVTPINEDGTTILELHYDRYYYIVDYDLNDSLANGATPCSVRYDTPIMLPLPSHKGYDFVKWHLVSVTDKDENGNVYVVNSHPYAAEISAGATINVFYNLVYRASWKPSSTIYTIVYWLENAESTNSNDKANYNVWYTYKVDATTGDMSIAGRDNVKQYITVDGGQHTQNEETDVTSTYPYLIYKANLTDTEQKLIVGNGQTTVNIYYARKEYTLKFYYAIEKTSNQNSTYHIIGGSTYYFGSYASGNARTDEVAAMRQYASGSSRSETGQVTALPTLNAKGLSRNYTRSYDVDGDNKYHYLTFNAKYGADLTNLWPCDVFNSAERTSANTHNNWSGKQAFVSAWNGEYNVRYTQDDTVNHGNQTIKGNYTQLDSRILWNSTSNAETTIAYACFWENGANVNWSVPELYRYNIYLPVLPGQDTTGLTLKYDGEGTLCYLAYQYDTCDDSTTSAQTQPALVGFTANGRSWETIRNFDTTLYKEAYDMYFFYSRNIYHLSFNDMHGNIVTTTVPYDTLVGDHSEEEHAPAYPSDLEPGEAKFAGWYFDETCTIFFDHDVKMPAKNIQLYAKWETINYTVKVYFDTEKTAYSSDDVPFGSFVDEPDYKTWQSERPAYKDLIFAGWYYKSGDDEIRFDFNTMMIKGDMELYAKWTSKKYVEYLVRFVIEQGGKYIDIAAPLQEEALAGTAKFFRAKVGDGLYDKYQSGYFPEMRSHTMSIKLDEASNVYCFVYTYEQTMTYTVTHTFVDDKLTQYIGTNRFTETFTHEIKGEDIVRSAASIHISFREGITRNVVAAAAQEVATDGQGNKIKLDEDDKDEIWNIVKGLSPDCYEHELVLTSTQTNAAEFEWRDLGGKATYQVIYYFENLDGEYVPNFDKIIHGNETINVTITAATPEHAGYVVNKNHANYSESGKVVGLSENPDGTLTSGLVLRIYYDLQRHKYTIYHYKLNTSIPLADHVTGIAPHGTSIKIEDVCKEIAGYTIDNQNTVVSILENDTKVVCYYKGLEVYYRYQVVGSAGGRLSVTSDDENVVGSPPKSTTLTLYDGYYLYRWCYMVGKGEYLTVPETWISDDKMTVTPDPSLKEWAGQTVYIYAEVLPVTRRFSVSGKVHASKEQAFVFNIKSKGAIGTATVDVTFVIFGNDANSYLDIAMLPPGNYTITVLDWAWRYGDPTVELSTSSGGSSNTDKVTAVGDGVFDITITTTDNVVFNYNTAPNDKWLSDDVAGYLDLTH